MRSFSRNGPWTKSSSLTIATRRYDDERILRIIDEVSGVPPHALLEKRWNAGKESDAFAEILRDRLAFGSSEALVNLRYVVKSTFHYKQTPIELVEFLSTVSDCPPKLPEAAAWLDQFADVATFDPEIKRYVIPAPGAKS